MLPLPAEEWTSIIDRWPGPGQWLTVTSDQWCLGHVTHMDACGSSQANRLDCALTWTYTIMYRICIDMYSLIDSVRWPDGDMWLVLNSFCAGLSNRANWSSKMLVASCKLQLQVAVAVRVVSQVTLYFTFQFLEKWLIQIQVSLSLKAWAARQ